MDKDLENREHEQPIMPLDLALDKYTEQAIVKITKGIDLLMAAEEAYTLSKACKPGKEKDKDEWRKRRDGFRAQGNQALFEAQELLFPNITTTLSGTEPPEEGDTS